MSIVFPKSIIQFINAEIIKKKEKQSSYQNNNFLDALEVGYKKFYSEYTNRSVLHDTFLITSTPLNHLNSFSVTCNDISINYGFVIYDDHDQPQMCCLGPCITTSFSEYRSSIFSIIKFDKVRQYSFYSVIKKFMERLLKENQIQLRCSKSSDYMKDAMILCIIYHLYDEINWEFYNYNSNPDYMNIFDTIIFPIRSYRKKYKKEITEVTQSIYTNLSESLFIDFGCKITPIYSKELQQYKNKSYAIWRTLYINDVINNLILSDITENFLLSFGWTFIDSSSKEIFTNQEIYNRIQSNEMIKKIKVLNTQVIEELHKKRSEIGIYDSIINKLMQNVLSNESLLKKVDTLSNMSMIQIYENRDNTFYNYIYNFITYNKSSIVTNMTNHHTIFKKFLFEISHALFCIHSNGIIHYDLHVNNVIIDGYKSHHKKTQSNIFVLDKEYEYIYQVPTHSFSVHIIDFDRSLLSSAHTFDVGIFIDDMIHELTHLFPKINKEKIYNILIHDTKSYMVAFHLFTAFDFLKITSILLNILAFKEFKEKYKNNQDYKQNIQFLKKIHKEAVHTLQKIINPEIYTSLQVTPLFAFTVLTTYFKEYRASQKNIVSDTIFRIFDINNTRKLNYSILKEYTYPNTKINKDMTELYKLIQKKEKIKRQYKKSLDSFIEQRFD